VNVRLGRNVSLKRTHRIGGLQCFYGIHNHELAPKLTGHLLAGRLKAEEKQRVINMTKSLAAPRNILTDLKEKNKESVTIIKQVYGVDEQQDW